MRRGSSPAKPPFTLEDALAEASIRARQSKATVTDAGPPRSWQFDLKRMLGGEIDRWFIQGSRDYLIAQGYIRVVLDPETSLWLGDQITDAGKAAAA
jgi:hypothetical protein